MKNLHPCVPYFFILTLGFTFSYSHAALFTRIEMKKCTQANKPFSWNRGDFSILGKEYVLIDGWNYPSCVGNSKKFDADSVRSSDVYIVGRNCKYVNIKTFSLNTDEEVLTDYPQVKFQSRPWESPKVIIQGLSFPESNKRVVGEKLELESVLNYYFKNKRKVLREREPILAQVDLQDVYDQSLHELEKCRLERVVTQIQNRALILLGVSENDQYRYWLFKLEGSEDFYDLAISFIKNNPSLLKN